jgi:hypothetical protein
MSKKTNDFDLRSDARRPVVEKNDEPPPAHRKRALRSFLRPRNATVNSFFQKKPNRRNHPPGG